MKILAYYFFIIFTLMLNVSLGHAETGEQIAENLNVRYNNTQECPLGEPDYACSGIIIHTYDADADITSGWYPTESGINRGVVSFSWLRNDINFYREGDGYGSIWGDTYAAGIIFSTLNKAILSNKTPSKIYCSYGYNGETKSRGNYGCAMNKPNVTIPNPDNFSSCYPLGVYTAEELVEKYFINKEGAYGVGDFDQCSFAANKIEFSEAMKVGQMVRDYTALRNNEIVVKEWSGVPVNEVPLEAFFYAYNYKPMDDAAKVIVQENQKRFYDETGLFIPIIMVDMKIIRNGLSTETVSPFFYNSDDQAVPVH